MNELQAKLARRRSLNGEIEGNKEAFCGTENKPQSVEPVKATTQSQQDPLQSFDDENEITKIKSNELHSKLARRRNLNGEINNFEQDKRTSFDGPIEEANDRGLERAETVEKELDTVDIASNPTWVEVEERLELPVSQNEDVVPIESPASLEQPEKKGQLVDKPNASCEENDDPTVVSSSGAGLDQEISPTVIEPVGAVGVLDAATKLTSINGKEVRAGVEVQSAEPNGASTPIVVNNSTTNSNSFTVSPSSTTLRRANTQIPSSSTSTSLIGTADSAGLGSRYNAPTVGAGTSASVHSSDTAITLSRALTSIPTGGTAASSLNSSASSSSSFSSPGQNLAGKKSSTGGWYPGKYILERKAPWRSKKSAASPSSLHMNPDVARSHYEELLLSSHKECSQSVPAEANEVPVVERSGLSSTSRPSSVSSATQKLNNDDDCNSSNNNNGEEEKEEEEEESRVHGISPHEAHRLSPAPPGRSISPIANYGMRGNTCGPSPSGSSSSSDVTNTISHSYSKNDGSSVEANVITSGCEPPNDRISTTTSTATTGGGAAGDFDGGEDVIDVVIRISRENAQLRRDVAAMNVALQRKQELIDQLSLQVRQDRGTSAGATKVNDLDGELQQMGGGGEGEGGSLTNGQKEHHDREQQHVGRRVSKAMRMRKYYTGSTYGTAAAVVQVAGRGKDVIANDDNGGEIQEEDEDGAEADSALFDDAEEEEQGERGEGAVSRVPTATAVGNNNSQSLAARGSGSLLLPEELLLGTKLPVAGGVHINDAVDSRSEEDIEGMGETQMEALMQATGIGNTAGLVGIGGSGSSDVGRGLGDDRFLVQSFMSTSISRSATDRSEEDGDRGHFIGGGGTGGGGGGGVGGGGVKLGSNGGPRSSSSAAWEERFGTHGLLTSSIDDSNCPTRNQGGDAAAATAAASVTATAHSGDATEKSVVTSDAQPAARLFGDEDEEALVSKLKLKRQVSDGTIPAMEYKEFLKKFTKCMELVDITREFLFSILGPNGDTTPPESRYSKLDYTFYGVYKLDVRCRSFFDQMQEMFLKYPEFQNETEERILCARDCLEQYVLYRIAEFAFKSTLDKEADEHLLHRMKVLSFLRPETLDIKSDLFDETLLAIAGDELRKINAYRTPGDKVACVVKCASVIFRSLSLSKTKNIADLHQNQSDNQSAAASRKETPSGTATAGAGGEAEKQKQDDSRSADSSIAGADDFLPLFIWVVMRSHIPRLCSNCEYIQTFLNPARLMGKSGYCLINLRSAIEFVNSVDGDQLNIDAKEFEDRLADAERELNGGFL